MWKNRPGQSRRNLPKHSRGERVPTWSFSLKTSFGRINLNSQSFLTPVSANETLKQHLSRRENSFSTGQASTLCLSLLIQWCSTTIETYFQPPGKPDQWHIGMKYMHLPRIFRRWTPLETWSRQLWLLARREISITLKTFFHSFSSRPVRLLQASLVRSCARKFP